MTKDPIEAEIETFERLYDVHCWEGVNPEMRIKALRAALKRTEDRVRKEMSQPEPERGRVLAQQSGGDWSDASCDHYVIRIPDTVKAADVAKYAEGVIRTAANNYAADIIVQHQPGTPILKPEEREEGYRTFNEYLVHSGVLKPINAIIWNTTDNEFSEEVHP